MIEFSAQELALLNELLGTANSTNPSIKVRIGLLHAKVQGALSPPSSPTPPASNREERRKDAKKKG